MTWWETFSWTPSQPQFPGSGQLSMHISLEERGLLLPSINGSSTQGSPLSFHPEEGVELYPARGNADHLAHAATCQRTVFSVEAAETQRAAGEMRGRLHPGDSAQGWGPVNLSVALKNRAVFFFSNIRLL